MKALLVLGPTASGKTAVALSLAARFPVEIVSVDSAQVYRGMDIGTAKPDRATRDRVPHHLIDIAEPNDAYSAGRFKTDALVLVREIERRGKIALLVGGTMLYFRSLALGFSGLPSAAPAIRRAIETRAAAEGWSALHAQLAKVDPVTAARIEPTDTQRIQRALEVHEVTGEPLSALQALGGEAALPFEALALVLEPSKRDVLHERIAQRFRAMLGAGLVEEVRGLRSRYALDETMPSMRAVGYRQAWDTLEGKEALETLEERGIAATRQLAKRQLTWLRPAGGPLGSALSPESFVRLDCLRPDLTEAAAERVARFLGD